MNVGIELMERGWLPDTLVRFGIRRLLAKRIDEINGKDSSEAESEFVQSLREGPVAQHTGKANEQHYEVPSDFFLRVLGPRLKYSSCIWPVGTRTLGEAEEHMLRLTCERAELSDGMDILELGCGWGSLTLWMAEQYPNARITAVSNSHSQREFIEKRAADRNLINVRVITADMNDFAIHESFDRVVSVEMFEHMRNYHVLLERIAGWLKLDGKLFIHIFCHREHTYPFETDGDDDWMGRYFFTGGLMPAEHLLNTFDDHLKVESQWRVNGIEYAKTLRAWLDISDQERPDLIRLLKSVYGETEGARWLQRWRVFFMACEELFAYRKGSEWFVTHILFSKQSK